MPAFEYVALDARGKEKKGVAEGDTARQVRQILRDKGMMPLQIEAARGRKEPKEGSAKPTFMSQLFARGISATELALITRQLATLIQAALPLEEALASVANQSEKPRIKTMIYAVRSKVMEGHTLAAGLAEFPKVFPQLYRATVDAGEQSGHLDTVLERLADYTENQQELQGKVRQALIYPAFLSIFAIAIVFFLMTNIVPKVVETFDDIGQDLPGLTKTLIAISDFFLAYGGLLLVGLVLAGFGFKYLMTKENWQERWHLLLFRIPVISKLVRGLNAALFTRTFSILSGSGVTVLESMKISAQVVANLPMRKAILEATDRVREGTGIKNSLETSRLFPPMTLQLIGSGENSGNLEDMLDRAASQLEREQVTMMAYIVGIMEPVIILAMGVMVLLIVLGILMPIFDLNQMVK